MTQRAGVDAGGLHDHAVAGRREQLERALEVLWMALDGDRRLQRGEQASFAEPAAGLVREIRAVTAELAGLPVESEGSKADELRSRREARRGRPKDPPSATKRSQSRRSNGVHRAG